jgi:hypothetical protein
VTIGGMIPRSGRDEDIECMANASIPAIK